MQRLPESPQLAALAQQVAAGDRAALDAFWRRVEESGTPLVEPIPDDPASALVTLLYRSSGPCEHVLVLSSLGESGQDEMARLPGTDSWYRTYRLRRDLRTVYNFLPNHAPVDWLQLPLEEGQAAMNARTAFMVPDALNPGVFDFRFPPLPDGTARPPASLLELADAPPQPWIAARPDIPRGEVTSQRLDSAVMGNAHIVWTYTPPGYSAEAEPYGLMVVFDGYAYTRTIDMPAILDNLLSESRIRPLVVAFVQGQDRLAELLCNPAYARFIAEELVPWMRGRFHVASSPERTIVAGMSAGGLAASFMTLSRPDVFGNVLSQSGSYWWRPEGDPEHEWLTRQYVDCPRHPVKFYLDVGLLERGPTFGAGPSMVTVNRHLRDVLRARGYSVSYHEFSGGHDFVCWRGTLARGLMALAGA